MYKLTNYDNIIRTDGAIIPIDAGNSDYQQYLKWLATGNTPEPADTPDPKLAIIAQITQLEAQQLLPRISREFMLLSFATQAAAAGVDPMANIAYAKLKAFDDQITGLRNLLV